jgi:uncharacterized protein
MKIVRNLGRLFFIGAFLVIAGCATYQSQVSSARDSMAAGRHDEAIESLKKQYESANGDQLAYLLEYATALHQAGKYEESNKAFALAEKASEQNDYTSVSRETGAMIVQEGIVQYKAEIFEFLLITIYRALNYLMLGDYDNAHVMARKLNEKLNKLSTEMDSDTKKRQASFAAYLAAMLWEAQGDWDNAFVLYSKAHDLAPEVDVIKRDALIAAKRSGRETDYLKYKKKYPELEQSLDIKNIKNKGEFVFIFQQGWIARKHMRPENRTFPMMVPVAKSISSADVIVDGKKVHSETVYDLDKISIQTMEAIFSKLVARALARQASRIAVRQSAFNNNDKAALQVAALATYIFEAMDTADLRQWSTLPASFQVARLYLSPGKHQIKIVGFNNQALIWQGEVTIQAGRKTFITQRAF